MQLLHVITYIESGFHGFGNAISSQARITNPVQDRYIRVFQLRNRTVTAYQTASKTPSLRRLSTQTVRNREHGIRAR